MNLPILRIEKVSKQYRLGLVDIKTISYDLKRWWYSIRGLEDPFIEEGAVNDRESKVASEFIWALKKISFDVNKGEVVGIIGKNGAGKSTLLKILSRITTPTTGSIKFNGKVASLLEVGTGFHGELTGRENIFLNGAILGMTKDEIDLKINEIIDFSGCSLYVDTPVKRYSSGMVVRLAFAVAAFLEPDILIVDEVLAVGDAEFQRKAIGKMQEISSGENGRTVLFVSHNMAAIQRLCTRGIVLDKGNIVFDGEVSDSIECYSNLYLEGLEGIEQHDRCSGKIELENIAVKKNGQKLKKSTSVLLGQKLEISFLIKSLEAITDLSIAIDIFNKNGELLSHLTNEDDNMFLKKWEKGITKKINVNTEKLLFIPGFYTMNLWIGIGHSDTLYKVTNFFSFDMEQGDYTKRTRPLPKHSKVYLHSNWTAE